MFADACDELDVELINFYFILTLLIALVPRAIGAVYRADLIYENLVGGGKVPCAPSRIVLALIALLFYAVASTAALIVRLEGGAYIDGINRLALIEYWVLQLLLATYFYLFYYCGRWLLGVAALIASIAVAGVDAALMAAVSPVAQSLLLLFVAWPAFLLILSIAIMMANSDRVVQHVTRKLTQSRRATATARAVNSV